MTLQVIKYRPLRWALTHLHERTERFIVIVASRRSGKTVSSINHIIRAAVTNPGTYAYIAPFKDQAKKVAWDVFKEYTSDLYPKYNEQELSITFENGGKILILGADNAEALRGLGLKGVILDEVADLKEGVFTKIILPMLAKDNGFAVFIGTPKGKNFFYDLYLRGQNREEDWYSVKLSVYDAKNLSLPEIEFQKKQMTDEEFLQEYMCDFQTAIGGAIYGKELKEMREEKRITRLAYDPAYPVYTFWDIGFSDKTAIIFMQKIHNVNYIIDYFENNNETTSYYADIVKNRGYSIDTNYLPHDAEHKTISNNGFSFKDQLEAMGLNCEIVPVPNNKITAINATRLKLKTIFIDEVKCEKLIDYLAMYQWKQGKITEQVPKHDHTSHGMDCLSYLALTTIYGNRQQYMEVAEEERFVEPFAFRRDRQSSGGNYGLD